MSGELQTIPARHGVATFVPRGRTIKIINTYGKQVVSLWAFSLAAPPEEGEEGSELGGEGEIEEIAEELKKEVRQEGEGKAEGDEKKEVEKQKTYAEITGQDKKVADKSDKESEKTEEANEAADDPPEQAPEEEATQKSEEKKQPDKRTWSSYLPSIPYRNKGGPAKAGTNPDSAAEKAQKDETSKNWSSYLPTGKSFSSYVPNVQLPDSKGVVSAFKVSHYRDPNKSYAEQLYDFSKTPVGAGSIAAATGGGTASSLYTAYNAYTKFSPRKSNQPPMEYLSLPHTRAAIQRLVPEVDDTLLTNLRSPIMTLIEDTTPGAHDTLTAACDASLYEVLGVDKPEEHGSCAENLVLALKELNEKVGLKGSKAVGADVTVYIAPTPLHLFMNAPIETDTSAQSEGAGARGTKLKIEEPKAKKRSYVRFRAERDIVIVMSACPMDVGPQNAGRPMAANFMVEEANEEDMTASTKSLKDSKAKNDTLKNAQNDGQSKEEEKLKAIPKPKGGPTKAQAVQKSAEAARRDSAIDDMGKFVRKDAGNSEPAKTDETPKPKRKPKKLETRQPLL